MSVTSRIRRQQILREAEGYIELMEAFDLPGQLPAALSQRLAERTLAALSHLSDAAAEHGAAQFLKGQALTVLKRYAEAVEPLRAAAQAEPADISIWLALGWCYKRVGRLDLAIESLESALNADPSRPIIPYNLACYYALAGNAAMAVDYLTRALAMDCNYRSLIDSESDFDPIRNDPGFQSLTAIIV